MTDTRKVLLVAAVIGLAGCATESETGGDAERPREPDAVVEAGVVNPAAVDSAQADELPPFAERVVLFVEATADDLDAARASRSEADHSTMADDLMWYRASAYEFLERNGFPVRTLQGRRTLRFVVDGEARPFDYSHIPTLDVIILYDTNRDPVAVAPIDIEEAVRSYFH